MNKINLFAIILFFVSLCSSVHADIPSGPEIIIIPIVFLAVIGGIIAGVVYSSYRILKWIKKRFKTEPIEKKVKKK